MLTLIAGLGELIPVVEPNFAAVPALAIASLDSPRQALVVLVFYLVGRCRAGARTRGVEGVMMTESDVATRDSLVARRKAAVLE